VSGDIPGAVNGYIYHAEVSAQRPAGHYTPRIVPGHLAAAVPMEAGFILWRQ
jgi:starch phosphorylase